MDLYKVGSGIQAIELSVDITTHGLAGTRANVRKKGEAPMAVAHSVDVTGDIHPQDIGAANNLGGGILVISTLIDLKILGDLEARKDEFDRIEAQYILDDGPDGRIVYDKPDSIQPSNDYTVVILLKQIQLIKS
jgi:hypothetical protein